MQKGDMRKQVFDWLSSQGYTLEMKVARKLQQRGFVVNSSVYYKDPVSAKAREIDVVSYKTKWFKKDTVFFNITFMIECKYSKKQPWILFRSANEYYGGNEIVFRNANEFAQIVLLGLSNNETAKKNFLFNLECPTYYGVTRAFENKNDIAYQAILSVCSAVDSRVYYENTEMNKYTLEIVFPIIVVEGLLFDAVLNKHSEIELGEVKYGKLVHSNPAMKDSKYIVDIVSFQNIDEYFNILSEAVDNIFQMKDSKIETAIGYMINARNQKSP